MGINTLGGAANKIRPWARSNPGRALCTYTFEDRSQMKPFCSTSRPIDLYNHWAWVQRKWSASLGGVHIDPWNQCMQSTGASLGLTHDPSCINKTGHVRFWARTRLHGKVRDFLPQHVKQATLLEAQLPNFMDLQTSWCKVFLGESGMAVSWPSRHATGALYGVVRLDRAPRPISTSTWSLVPRQRCRSHDLGERAL